MPSKIMILSELSFFIKNCVVIMTDIIKNRKSTINNTLKLRPKKYKNYYYRINELKNCRYLRKFNFIIWIKNLVKIIKIDEIFNYTSMKKLF